MGRLILINSDSGGNEAVGMQGDVYLDPLTERVWTLGYFPNAPHGQRFIPLRYRPDLPPEPRQQVQPISVAGQPNTTAALTRAGLMNSGFASTDR